MYITLEYQDFIYNLESIFELNINDDEKIKDKIDDMELEIAELRHEISRLRNTGSISPEKSLVTKKSIYEMIIFKE